MRGAHLSPNCTHKHMLENGAPHFKFGVLYRLLHIEFHGFINYKRLIRTGDHI